MVTKDHVLVSFDVVNCFGNIPTELALQIIERNFNIIAEHTPIGKEDFLELLRIYLQPRKLLCLWRLILPSKPWYVYGVVIGTHPSRTRHWRHWQSANRTETETRWMDDHLTSIPRDIIEVLTNKLNSFYPKVQFTVEIEDEITKSINFLDTTVFNQNGKLIMKWYYKEIASNRVLNFHSCHPRNMVLNVAKAFIRRVISHHIVQKGMYYPPPKRSWLETGFRQKSSKNVSTKSILQRIPNYRTWKRVTHSWTKQP